MRRSKTRGRRALVERVRTFDGGILSVLIPVVIESESNKRGHWSVAYGRKVSQQRVVSACLAGPKPAPGPAGWFVWLTRIAPRTLDPGNLEASFKHAQDAVAFYLGVDDGDRARVEWRYGQTSHEAPNTYGLLVYIVAREVAA